VPATHGERRYRCRRCNDVVVTVGKLPEPRCGSLPGLLARARGLWRWKTNIVQSVCYIVLEFCGSQNSSTMWKAMEVGVRADCNTESTPSASRPGRRSTEPVRRSPVQRGTTEELAGASLQRPDSTQRDDVRDFRTPSTHRHHVLCIQTIDCKSNL
jgi:hypothetical protein